MLRALPYLKQRKTKNKGVIYIFSIVAVKLLFLLLPGLIGKKIIDKFSLSKDKKDFNYFIIDSFIIGCVSYFILFFVTKFSNHNNLQINNNFIDLYTFASKIDYEEVIYASIISVVISILYSYARENDWFFKLSRLFFYQLKKLPFNFLNLFSPPNRTASTSMLYDIFSREELKTYYFDKWCLIKLKTFSEVEYMCYIERWLLLENNQIDLLISDVIVYSKESESHRDKIYLRVNLNDITIEFLDGGDKIEQKKQ